MRIRTYPSTVSWCLLGVLILIPQVVWAHSQQFPIAGKKLSIHTSGSSDKSRSFSFKAVKQLGIVPAHNPATDGSTLLVAGSDGKTALIALDPVFWKALGNPTGSKGYHYADKTGSRGGVKAITYKPGTNGGTLSVRAGGPNWTWLPNDAQSSVWVYFRVEDELYCAKFGGSYTKNEAGLIRAKDATVPTSCAAACGNGVMETGEECDDGNLDNTDGCTTSCTAGTCSGQVFNSTWDAIQQVIFNDSSCTNSLCHGSATPAGGLDLRPANAYNNLVNVHAQISTLDRVEPGDQDLSFLYLKLAASTLAPNGPSVPGSPMPSGLPAISANSLAALRLWIRAGAPVGGVVEGTAPLLNSCLPPPAPQKIPPLDPPPAGVGVQIYAPPWDLPAHSEDEVCYPSYYDFTLTPGLVPASAQVPCPGYLGGPSETCFLYHQTELAQDPQSHHSIIHIYRGAYDTTAPGWGTWTCKGGANAGMACNPTGIGTDAPAGADCGPRSGCTGDIKSSVACILFGPPDYGFNNNVAPSFGGSQEPLSSQTYAPGVYNLLPMKGIVVFNSHAFNLTGTDTTMEQYYNLTFAGPADQSYPVQGIFDATEIFVQNVPAFETREYCRTYTAPTNAQIFELTSHGHKRSVRFRIWAPPNTSCTAAGGCLPNAGSPIYISTQYNDPVRLAYSPPVNLTGLSATDRTYKFCALYDNGFTDHSLVKRRSTSPPPPQPFAPGGPCAVSETRCIDGPQHNQLCNGNNAFCDSSMGAGDGVCDSCPLRGGVTTEDEMMIMLGSYYIAP